MAAFDKSRRFDENCNFSYAVKWYMERNGMTPSDLVRATRLPKTTISRILRNENDKGSSYMPSYRIVWAICIGLKLAPEEIDELFDIAFPENRVCREGVAKKQNVVQINQELFDKGLPLLINLKDE